MSVDRNELRAGALLLVALVVLGGGLLVLAGSGSLFADTRIVPAVFANVRGVREGDPVRFAGLQVGEVETLRVRTDLVPNRIEAGLRVPVDLVIPRDSDVRVVETLTGARIIEIYPGKEAPLAEGGSLVDERVPIGLDGIAERADGLAGEVTGVVAEAKALLERLDLLAGEIAEAVEGERVGRVIENLETASGEIVETARSLRATVDEVLPAIREGVDGFRDTSREAADLVREARPEIREILASVKAAADGAAGLLEGPEAPLTRTMAKIETAAEGLNAALEQVENTGREAQDLIAGSRPKVETILDRLRTTGVNLKAASEDLRAHPWKLLNEPDEADQRVQEVFGAARNFNTGAEALADAVRELRAAMERRDTDDPEVRRLVDALGRSYAEYERAEKLFWEVLRGK